MQKEENRKFTADDIQTLSTKEWFQIRFFEQAEIDPLYVIIGFLQEYFGGYSLHEETVDMFFVNEFEKAQVFKKLCDYYLASQQLENDISLLKVESGHSYVLSKTICKKLEAYFTEKLPQFLSHKCFKLPKTDDVFKTPEELYGDRSFLFNFKRYSYLLGVVIKNKMEHIPAINFANASHKAELSIKILRDFTAFGDNSMKVEYFFGAPHVTRINLSEANSIWKEADAYVTHIQK
ncbi:hypothetical protein [Kordia sp.]|uniref:hypothetical protein n=1 Tax=Kordia sp. TaxID=1965332 RepID=UPI003B59E734